MSLRKVCEVYKLYCLLSTLSNAHCVSQLKRVDDLSVEYANEMHFLIKKKANENLNTLEISHTDE